MSKIKIKNGFFITGTDTHVGKTFFACRLLKKLAQEGHKTVAIKPVASGCIETSEGLCNDDAMLLRQQTTEQLSYTDINPFAFLPPIAPSIAAEEIGCELNIKNIVVACQPVLQEAADYVIIEGAGGWQVPLNDTETMADLAVAFGYPVILVVAIRLGCINHALLSFESIQRSGLKFAGWVANVMDLTVPYADEIIATLQKYIGSPLKL